VAHLRAGEQIVVPRQGRTAAVRNAAATEPAERREPVPAPTMLLFDETTLARAVEQMNRQGAPPVRLGDAALANLRITGAFRAGDTSGFGESVAAAFDLTLDRGADGSLWLRPRPGATRPN
jgi:ferric-dicitrate binding protein FerR (iron transport regulator)